MLHFPVCSTINSIGKIRRRILLSRILIVHARTPEQECHGDLEIHTNNFHSGTQLCFVRVTAAPSCAEQKGVLKAVGSSKQRMCTMYTTFIFFSRWGPLPPNNSWQASVSGMLSAS